jgi:hypothetical protein
MALALQTMTKLATVFVAVSPGRDHHCGRRRHGSCWSSQSLSSSSSSFMVMCRSWGLLSWLATHGLCRMDYFGEPAGTVRFPLRDTQSCYDGLPSLLVC